MTKTAALHKFFNSFGIAGYPSSSVPDNAEFPYLVYTPVVNAWDDGEAAITVNLWYYGESEAEPNAMVQKISMATSMGGAILRCDGGAIWVKRGSPFAQTVVDGTDPVHIKQRYINLLVEYFTQD